MLNAFQKGYHIMATIKDIAQITGVSATTVSNVIHGRSKRVSPETVDKINRTIKELGYVPNMSARSLVSSSSKVIAFINHMILKEDSNFMEDPFNSTFVGILEKTLRENGYYLMIRTVSNSEELISFLQNWNIDGLFFTGLFQDSFFEIVNSLKLPTVLIDSYVRSSKTCNVGLEDFQGSYDVTQYLIEKGHTNIAFVSPSIKDGGVLQERFLGYRAALAKAKLSFQKDYIFVEEMDFESCKHLAKQIKSNPAITAIVTTADIMAATLINCLKAEGLRIPEDISITGFDDLSICRLTTPTITTVRQDMQKKGNAAVDFMLRLLDGDDILGKEITLSTTLIERESVQSLDPN